MPLVSEKEILSLAKGKDFAVPGFFAFNYEFIKIIIDVAEEERCPVVLCQGPEFIKKTEKLFLHKHVRRPQCMQRYLYP